MMPFSRSVDRQCAHSLFNLVLTLTSSSSPLARNVDLKLVGLSSCICFFGSIRSNIPVLDGVVMFQRFEVFVFLFADIARKVSDIAVNGVEVTFEL